VPDFRQKQYAVVSASPHLVELALYANELCGEFVEMRFGHTGYD
jgi:hypothetical protein